MSSSGGSNVGKLASDGLQNTIRSWINDPIGNNTAAFTDMASAGFAKYNPNEGGFSDGTVLHHGQETLGAIDGYNAGRLAATDKAGVADEAARASQIQTLNMQLQAYRADQMASRNAAGIRATADARSNSTAGFAGMNQQQPVGMQGQPLGNSNSSLLGL